MCRSLRAETRWVASILIAEIARSRSRSRERISARRSSAISPFVESYFSCAFSSQTFTPALLIFSSNPLWSSFLASCFYTAWACIGGTSPPPFDSHDAKLRCLAWSKIFGIWKNSSIVNENSNAVSVSAIALIISKEWPPRSKKLSKRPTRSTLRTSCQIAAKAVSVSPIGASYVPIAYASVVGAGRALRSSFPLDVKGRERQLHISCRNHVIGQFCAR